MRAISIMQPWAWLIVHGPKNIENRGWRANYRGPVLIHASARMTPDGYDDAVMFATRVGGIDLASRVPDPESADLARGGIVGIATVVDLLPPGPQSNEPWHIPGQWGFVLGDRRPLPFHPCKGALNFWGSFAVRNGRVEAVAA